MRNTVAISKTIEQLLILQYGGHPPCWIYYMCVLTIYKE